MSTAFMTDLSERLSNRVQLSSDALAAYEDATERAFGADVDYGHATLHCKGRPESVAYSYIGCRHDRWDPCPSLIAILLLCFVILSAPRLLTL